MRSINRRTGLTVISSLSGAINLGNGLTRKETV
jgi:hypothetical protein